jgi:hypothetical protein
MFRLSANKLIIEKSEASSVLVLGEDDEDVLNEVRR